MLLKNLTICARSPIYVKTARSPAFRIEGYSLDENPYNYSLWTESGLQIYDEYAPDRDLNKAGWGVINYDKIGIILFIEEFK